MTIDLDSNPTTTTPVAPPAAAGPSHSPAPRPARTGRRGSGRSSRARSVAKHLGLVAFALLMLYPLLWMLASSFRPNERIFQEPGLFPLDFRLDNYIDGWNALAQPFGHYLMNSTILVVGCILGNLLSCSLAAYAFARVNFRFKRALFSIMLITIMLPVHVIIVPQYIAFSQLGMVNTFWPILLPKFFATEAFFIFLMVQFIRGIPRELDEAARLDGCGHWGIFTRIILPLMVPALAATAVFTFISSWNDFFSSLIYLTSPDMFTVPVALRSFIDSQGSSSWGEMFAMSIVSLIPVFFAFLFGQKFLINGIATTGGK